MRIGKGVGKGVNEGGVLRSLGMFLMLKTNIKLNFKIIRI